MRCSLDVQIQNQKASTGKASAMFRQPDFLFEKLGIGGLDAQFAEHLPARLCLARLPHIISK